jgi:hypothetical protein
MTDTGMVLWLFSGLAVLAVVSILGAAIWAHARSAARERLEPAYDMAGRDANPYNTWLAADDDPR